ncbi:hypothetical protein Amsp01_041700 [Amycolatopsis sp. NBRC 101858]|nr:hypothetical protein Amsp01_041700 [Amycolatopsis sp. NBRC 101858]
MHSDVGAVDDRRCDERAKCAGGGEDEQAATRGHRRLRRQGNPAAGSRGENVVGRTADRGFAPGSWGMFANLNSLTSGIGGTVWGLNETAGGGSGGGGTAAPAPRTYSPYGGRAIVC